MPSDRRVGIYVRVSLGTQNTQSQENALREFAAAKGWCIYKVYADSGVSGAKERRPALDAMWVDCQKRKINTCLIFSLDRLARSLKQLIHSLEEFGRLNVDLVCLKQDIDTTTSSGRLLYHVVGAVCEFERDLIRARVVSGMDNARRKGRHIGRPPLRRFSSGEVAQIQEARASEHTSIRKLAIMHGTTQFMIAQILAGQRVVS
jgi:DNA invertase Pin-like site-specific DNA recombinase